MRTKIFTQIIIAAFGIYVIYLYHANKLGFYIHPRYILFTYVSGVLMLSIGVAMLQRDIPKLLKMRRPVIKLNKLALTNSLKNSFGYALLLIPLLLGFLLPVKPLSSATTTQRFGDLNSLRGNPELNSQVFTADTKSLTLGDWVVALNANPNLEFYEDKEVSVSGFIFKSDTADDIFLLSRFAITCCAVDARPVGLYVRSQDWKDKYSQDQWLAIEGKFATSEIAGEEQLVIVPDLIEKIAVPDEPYIY